MDIPVGGRPGVCNVRKITKGNRAVRRSAQRFCCRCYVAVRGCAAPRCVVLRSGAVRKGCDVLRRPFAENDISSSRAGWGWRGAGDRTRGPHGGIKRNALQTHSARGPKCSSRCRSLTTCARRGAPVLAEQVWLRTSGLNCELELGKPADEPAPVRRFAPANGTGAAGPARRRRSSRPP